jgi:flagellar hook assembly protein FlgD
VKETCPVTIEVYNLKGQLVRTLVNEIKTAGNYSVVWNGRDNNNQPVSSGVYFYKMNTGKYSSTKKMILMK